MTITTEQPRIDMGDASSMCPTCGCWDVEIKGHEKSCKRCWTVTDLRVEPGDARSVEACRRGGTTTAPTIPALMTAHLSTVRESGQTRPRPRSREKSASGRGRRAVKDTAATGTDSTQPVEPK